MIQTFGVFRILRLLKFTHFKENLRCFKCVYFKCTGGKGKNFLMVFNLIVAIFATAHWLGCIFYFIAYVEHPEPNWASCAGENEANRLIGGYGCPQSKLLNYGMNSTVGDGDTNSTVSGIDVEPILNAEFQRGKLITDRHVRSVYWATTALTTAGFGDVSATTLLERVFSIFVLIIGTLIFAAVIANLEEIVAQVDVTSTLFQIKVGEVNAFMKLRSIGPAMQENIGRYYDALWLRQKGASEISVLSYLPVRVRHEVLKHHVMKTLKSAPVFEKFDVWFLNKIIDRLDSEFFLAQQTVYEKGQCATELYMLSKGSIAMMDGKNTLMTIRNGQMFGEGEFFKHEPRVCNSVATEYSNAFILDQVDLHKLLQANFEHEVIYDEQIVAAADR